jgi:hypothetical protein
MNDRVPPVGEPESSAEPPGTRPPAPPLDAEAIIINCSTREQTTLALASVLRHAALPAAVIDCESTDGSYPFFRRLQERLPFRLARMPLRPHGVSLDRIFRDTGREALLLVDSDAEILRDDLLPAMTGALGPAAYGSGFLHRGQWLGANHLVEGNVGYYAPRMWIPCVLLKVAPVRAALDAGASFRDRVLCNEVPQLPALARLLYLRLRVPWLRGFALDGLSGLRRTHFGARPHYVYYDTGALLHERITGMQHLGFAALPDAMWPEAVRHYHGVTRRRLRRRMRNAADLERTRREALARVEEVYGLRLPELETR